jgi:c(7)-type cytochrome triheme protein
MKRADYFFRLGLLLVGLAGLAGLAALSSAAVTDPVVGDVLFVRKTKGSDDIAPAVFPHWVHRVQFKCYVCHNNTVGFQMKEGSADITMDTIEEGKHCGQCHKGKTAFGVSFETCTRCHRK